MKTTIEGPERPKEEESLIRTVQYILGSEELWRYYDPTEIHFKTVNADGGGFLVKETIFKNQTVRYRTPEEFLLLNLPVINLIEEHMKEEFKAQELKLQIYNNIQKLKKKWTAKKSKTS